MSQIYQMKSSFDGTTWNQLEWLDVGFREFEEVGKPCNSLKNEAYEMVYKPLYIEI